MKNKLAPSKIWKYFRLSRPYVSKIVPSLENWFHYAGWALVLFLMVFVTVGVLGRYLLNRPILGQTDIAELVIGVIVFLGLAYTQRTGAHARVEILVNRLKGRAYHLLESLTLFLPLVVFLIIAISSFNDVMFLKEIGDTTPTIHVPTWPFKITVSIGSGLLCARFALQLFRHLAGVTSEAEGETE